MDRFLRLLLLVTLLGSPFLQGDEDDEWDDDKDHERARRALREADLLPLAEILASVEGGGRARVIEVELDKEKGRFLYELKVLTRKGRLLEMEIDASSGAILEWEEEDEEDEERSRRERKRWKDADRDRGPPPRSLPPALRKGPDSAREHPAPRPDDPGPRSVPPPPSKERATGEDGGAERTPEPPTPQDPDAEEDAPEENDE